MKKIILALVLFFILSYPALSQGPIFIPLILKGIEMPTVTEKWKVISPVESTNYVLNPSAEATGNYSALGSATVTRSSTYQKYGVYAYRVQTGSNGQGISLTLSTLPNENCFATARMRGKLPINLRFIIGTGLKTPRLIEKVDTQWNLYGVEFNAAECSGRTELRIIQQGSGIGDFYVDGIQVENLEYWTTYIDGDQEGCYWSGSAHATTSTRSGKSRAGGQVKDLYNDYGFFVEKVLGGGTITRELAIDEYAFLPGGELNSIKIKPREWSLIGKFVADSEGEILQNRQDLIKLLRQNPQKEPTKFLFYHPDGVREIKTFYAGGLEGDQSVFYDSWITEDDDKWAQLNKYIEKSAIQLKSPDPYFYAQGDKVASLDVNDSAIFRLVAGRLQSTGQWSSLGPPGAPGTAVYTQIWAIVEDNTYIYFGGDFQNFDNIANADYIVRYHKVTGAWSALGTGMDDYVTCLTLGPDGALYAGGAFTTSGGVATNGIGKWNGATWSALGVGTNSVVSALIFGPDGTLYVGGAFTTAGGGVANRIATWNGIGWTAVGTGMNGAVASLVFGLDGTLYAGGLFTTAGGGTANRIAAWDGSAWSALGSGMNSDVNALVLGPDGSLYAAGLFTTAGGNSTNYIAKWNGTTWLALGSGTNSFIYSLAMGPDGILYAGGAFTMAGGITLSDNVARWNGYAWSHLDIDLPGSSTIYAIMAGQLADPVIRQKYNLYLGFNTTGTGYFAGKISATNDGSVDIPPKFIFKRSGGTSIVLETIKNESTGKELLLDYDLLDGEQLTIDLGPTKKSVISNYFGSRPDAILTNSDFGTWLLEVGNNDITSFSSDQFALYPSSLDSFMLWKETYESYD